MNQPGGCAALFAEKLGFSVPEKIVAAAPLAAKPLLSEGGNPAKQSFAANRRAEPVARPQPLPERSEKPELKIRNRKVDIENADGDVQVPSINHSTSLSLLR